MHFFWRNVGSQSWGNTERVFGATQDTRARFRRLFCGVPKGTAFYILGGSGGLGLQPKPSASNSFSARVRNELLSCGGRPEACERFRCIRDWPTDLFGVHLLLSARTLTYIYSAGDRTQP